MSERNNIPDKSEAKPTFADVLHELGPYTDDHFKQVWQNAHFCLDTNVLLNAYRYSEAQRDKFFEILVSIKDRLFVPHTVAREFARNRKVVVRYRSAPVDEVRKSCKAVQKTLEDEHSKHPDKKAVVEFIEEMLSTLDSKFGIAERVNKKLVHNDTIAVKIAEMLELRVGKPLSEQEVKDDYEKRKKEKIPPYCSVDERKKERADAMGDVRLWLELKKEYQNKGTPLIFVTNDQKTNWWDKEHGYHEPQSRLLIEMAECTKSVCLFYTAERFIDTVSEQLSIVGTEALEKETHKIARRLRTPVQQVVPLLAELIGRPSKNELDILVSLQRVDREMAQNQRMLDSLEKDMASELNDHLEQVDIRIRDAEMEIVRAELARLKKQHRFLVRQLEEIRRHH